MEENICKHYHNLLIYCNLKGTTRDICSHGDLRSCPWDEDRLKYDQKIRLLTPLGERVTIKED